MGQDHDKVQHTRRGKPVCTHRTDADEPFIITGRSEPDPAHPEDQSSVTVEVNELHMYSNSLEERCHETMLRALSESDEEARFTEDEDKNMRYEAKPLHVWLFAGLAAVFCLWLQHYIYLHHEDWGAPFGGLSGYVRLGLLLLCGYLAFVAWPWRRLVGETPEERAKLQSARYSFIDKFRKH